MTNVNPIPDTYPRVIPLAAGAQFVSEPADHFYGDRVATIDDPYGHR